MGQGPAHPVGEDIALPRENGELLFESPWEARVFGLAIALHEKGAFPWKVFSQALAEEISTAEQSGETSTYYQHWLRALRQVATGEGLLLVEEILERAELVRAEADHDHDHDHDH